MSGRGMWVLEIVFWGSALLMVYTYAAYPAILYALGRRRRSPPRHRGDAPFPSVCLIISAFNEEKVIQKKIENSLSLRYSGGLSIVVASDGSTDATVSIARSYVDPRLGVHDGRGRRGKNSVLNDVLLARREEVIVFTDANSLFEQEALERLCGRLRDLSVGCAVGKLHYTRDPASVARGESLYWRYESLVSTLESRLGSVLVANGSIFAVRRKLIHALFPDVANDFQLPFEVANQGLAIVYEPTARAVEHSAELWREEFDRKVRIVLRGLTGFARMRRQMRGFRLWQFASHKLLRWCVGAFLAVALVSSAVLAPGSPLYASALAGQVVCYAAAFVGWSVRGRRTTHPILYVPFYFTMVNCAAAVALACFVAGRRQVVWEKAESTRRGAGDGAPTSAGEIGGTTRITSGGRRDGRA